MIARNNNLMRVPAELVYLPKVTKIDLRENAQLSSVPEEMQQLIDRGVEVHLDEGVAVGEKPTDTDILDDWRDRCPALKRLWNDDVDLSELEGVTFGDDDEEVVVSLNISDHGFTGDVPAGVGQLTHLTELVLHGNKFTNFAADVSGLTSLQTLYVSDFPGLKKVPKGTHRLTASLRVLALENCGLAAVPPELGDLVGLERLNLGTNAITSLPAEIGKLTALDKLALFGNQLTTLPSAGVVKAELWVKT